MFRTKHTGNLKSMRTCLAGILVSITMIHDIASAETNNALGALHDPAAHVSDLYFFRSWENPDNVVLIMNVAPGQEPGDGPMYFHFDDSVVYRLNIDNDMDGKANDIVYEFRFETESRPAYGELTFPLPYVGNPNIVSRPELRGIVALEGPGSEGITLRQTYSVTEIRQDHDQEIFGEKKLVVVPPNVGPVTMPDYNSLAAQGIYLHEESGIRVFAGQRTDSFYGDVGALFDGAAPRRFPPIATEEEDLNNAVNPFGVNRNAGFNVHSIAIEIPISLLTKDGHVADTTNMPMIGVYASALRPNGRYGSKGQRNNRHDNDDDDEHHHGKKFKQVSRMGNPMVNALIIDVPNKDVYNRSAPENDAKFAALYSDPPLARPPTSEIFGIPVPPAPRLDLVSTFLQYPQQVIPENSVCGDPCADLLRLNVAVMPTLPDDQQRLGALLGNDPAGFPNGRRPNDDPVDVVVRLIGGPALIFARVSDGVNYANGTPGAGTGDGPGYGQLPGNVLDVNNQGIVLEFPYLATPHSGRIHNHDH